MHLDIPSGNFAGYIFDLDGTLVDTMPLHYRAWCEAFREYGHGSDIDERMFYSLGGMPALQVAALFNRQLGTHYDPVGLRELKEDKFGQLLPHAPLISAVVDFARKVACTHPVSVASGGPRSAVTQTLAMRDLTSLFPVVVTADDVVHGKPAPDTFLLAATRMGVPPGQCLVFEDAELGIMAAEAAGMRWVRVARPS